MDSSKPDLTFEIPGVIQVYNDGRVERLMGTDFVPPSSDPVTGVSSKDVVIFPDTNVSARFYLPKLARPDRKLPLVVYFHGGAFCVLSPFSSIFHNYLNKLVAEANVVAVSVNYRKAPEHPIPAAYDDSWAALQWVFSHSSRDGPELWLNDHADFKRVFLAGESAGANIAHNMAMISFYQKKNMAMIAGVSEIAIELLGLALLHPFFCGSEPIGSEITEPGKKASVDKIWAFANPSNTDKDDPRVNPMAADGPGLDGLACKRVLVCVAEKDILRDRGWFYYEALGRSGWMGVVEFTETQREDHAFYLFGSENDEAKSLIIRLAAFLNRDMPFL